ncbi:hypothetical protein [Luteibacter sp. UNCMF366Tsu5.1]|uniref:hypothetical protein n=1 Tax=Luteibacter sp. UNCMF366Tsu5.1 TaxID=1502758 RepID=UPI000908CBF9|nr:hypothetical protein [Luteibacter sp. UNCMF366Tsu5.1]SFW74860.1 hypothetical protein SAMN02800691_3482 [Luteibacter sp. UNCMF366Tsu5.1]
MRRIAILLASLALVSACSSPQDQQAAQAPAADNPANEAAKKLETYQQLLKLHNDGPAVQLGHEIVDKYPDTPAAAEVKKTLDELEANYKAASEKTRLAALWLYQTSPMQGGTQSTATIQSTRPNGDQTVRLILRRHTAWGQSVFLYATTGKGFVCQGDCSLKATFDGKPKTIKAFRPPTGEPALLFRNDAAFLKDLAKTKRLTIDVVTVSRGETTLVFETGGFDPEKWAPLPKKK